MSNIDKSIPAQVFNWRAHLAVHPAAELFPLMSEAELQELAEDIKTHGLHTPIVGYCERGGKFLLDGRNRLDAMARLGLLYETDDRRVGLRKWTGNKWSNREGGCIEVEFAHYHGDPYVLATALNVHRRHLIPEQKRELIAKLVTATPEKSNRQIAAQAKVSHPTVAKERKRLEKKGDVETVTTSIDSKGRKQPAKKKKPEPEPLPVQPTITVAESLVMELESAETSAEKREAEYAAAPDALAPETVSAKDISQQEFDNHVLRLAHMTAGAKRWWFHKTSVPGAELNQLGRFLIDTAGEIQDSSERALVGAAS